MEYSSWWRGTVDGSAGRGPSVVVRAHGGGTDRGVVLGSGRAKEVAQSLGQGA